MNKIVMAGLLSGLAWFMAGPLAGAGEPQPIDGLLASANVDQGKSSTLRLGCVACHSFNQGGRNGVGPNLYDIVGKPEAAQPGYSYSTALKGKGGTWSYDNLDAWLARPASFAPGTRMTLVGVPDPRTMANVIAYLRSLSPSPAPLPSP